MKNNFDILKTISPQDKIKDLFLKDKINLQEFKDMVVDLDQSRTHVEEAEKNIVLLEDKGVKNKIFESGEEAIKEWKKVLSLSYFHKGQKNFGIEDFEKACEYAESGFKSWFDYTTGTLAYFKKDVKKLRKIISVIDYQDRLVVNKQILERLLESLENNEEVSKENYLKKYSGISD